MALSFRTSSARERADHWGDRAVGKGFSGGLQSGVPAVRWPCSQVATCSQSGITVSSANKCRSNEHKGMWQVDITDRKALERLFSVHRFDYVLNAAACTAVDQAEEDEIRRFSGQ